MSKFLKFIVHFVIICTIAIVLGLALPPFFGVKTVIVDNKNKETNLAMGSVTYAIPVKTETVNAGAPILVQDGEGTYRYNLVSVDRQTNTGVAIDPEAAASENINVSVKNWVPKVVVTVPLIGYLMAATESTEGIIVLALAVLFLIILYVIAELWKKPETLDEYEDLQGDRRYLKTQKELKMEEIDDTMGKGKLIDEIFGEFCEGSYIQPTFITDYPVEMSPLTKMHRSKPGLTERFELMVNGKELANAYSELNDPLDQEERFKEQMRLADKGDDEAMIIDQDFLRALQYGMPPTSGIGIGIDRLVMLMTGQTTIQEVLFFPQMRPEKVIKKDPAAKYMELGIAEDWVPVIQKAGYNTVADMQDVNPQKLHQDICGINKKYKLELTNPSVNDVTEWINKLK